MDLSLSRMMMDTQNPRDKAVATTASDSRQMMVPTYNLPARDIARRPYICVLWHWHVSLEVGMWGEQTANNPITI